NGVADRRMVPPVVEPPDLRGAPTAHLIGNVHRNLPTERRRMSVAGHTPWPESSGDYGVDFDHRYSSISWGKGFIKRKHRHNLPRKVHWPGPRGDTCRLDRRKPGTLATSPVWCLATLAVFP